MTGGQGGFFFAVSREVIDGGLVGGHVVVDVSVELGVLVAGLGREEPHEGGEAIFVLFVFDDADFHVLECSVVMGEDVCVGKSYEINLYVDIYMMTNL